MDYKKFYRETIKADITLDSREAVKKILGRIRREEKREVWKKIKELEKDLTKATDLLKAHGYLKIDIANKKDLISSLLNASKNIKYKTAVNKRHEFIKNIEKLREAD